MSLLAVVAGLCAVSTEATGAEATVIPVDEPAAEILVTAQKRSEAIQSVPISLAAFSGGGLARQNVQGLLDLGRVAPGFQAVRSSSASATRLGVRGVGSLGNTLIEPSVAVFLDGVYVPRSGAMLVIRIHAPRSPTCGRIQRPDRSNAMDGCSPTIRTAGL